MLETISSDEQAARYQRAQWLKQRRTGIGGSDAAASVGLNPYRSPYQLWQDKRGEKIDDDPENEAQELGTELEDFCATMLTKRTGLKLARVNVLERDAKHKFMIANVDRRVVGAREGVECKTAGMTSGGFISPDWGEPGTDAVPMYHLLQCQHYMRVKNWERVHVAALLAGIGFRHYVIERDQSLIEMLVELESKFWEHVQSNVPPAVRDASDAFSRWPKSVARPVTVTAELLPVVYELRDIRRAKKNAELAEKIVAGRIGAFLEDCDELLDEGGRPLLTWRSQTASRIDPDRLRSHYPAVAADCTKTSTSRVMLLKKGIE